MYSLRQAEFAARSVPRPPSRLECLEQELADTKERLRLKEEIIGRLANEIWIIKAEHAAEIKAFKERYEIGGVPPTLNHIAQTVCDFYKISMIDLAGRSRMQQFVKPRHIFCYLARKLTKKSFPSIARRLDDRDHTTVLNAYRKIHGERLTDLELDKELTELERVLGDGR